MSAARPTICKAFCNATVVSDRDATSTLILLQECRASWDSCMLGHLRVSLGQPAASACLPVLYKSRYSVRPLNADRPCNCSSADGGKANPVRPARGLLTAPRNLFPLPYHKPDTRALITFANRVPAGFLHVRLVIRVLARQGRSLSFCPLATSLGGRQGHALKALIAW